jgi:6,7-dimethyl-8-ribityllumazine synthase
MAGNPEILEGDSAAEGARIAVVAARFNGFVVDKLIAGALDVLRQQGVPDDEVILVRVPGAFELPLAVQELAASGDYDAIVALGAVIRGETPHFDFVAGECARGLSQVALETGVPVAFGVLTCDTAEQALDRAGGKAGNKGADAVMTALEMSNLLQLLDNEQ